MALDVGCGVGRTSLALALEGWTVLGIDPSARAVRLAQRSAAATPAVRGRVAFEVADATQPPPSPWQAGFDLVVCSEVIEHVADPAAVVDLTWRVLKPGGILLLTTPHDPGQWTVLDEYAGHVQRFTLGALRGLLGQFELLDLATEGFPFQRAAMQLYQRARSATGSTHSHDAIGQSRLYDLYVRSMPALLAVDHQLRRLGLGTTIVAVARRRH
jgi:SAM-dependent methyltransferase